MGRTMKKLVQCELSTGPAAKVRTVTWVEATLNPKPGMRLEMKGDARVWTVVQAYLLSPLESDDINSTWKVGGLS
jgi:hypothetical protein